MDISAGCAATAISGEGALKISADRSQAPLRKKIQRELNFLLSGRSKGWACASIINRQLWLQPAEHENTRFDLTLEIGPPANNEFNLSVKVWISFF